MDNRNFSPVKCARPDHTSEHSTIFQSILFPNPTDFCPDERLVPPDIFGDLNLDQIIAAITSGKEEYNLTPFFYMPLHDKGDILFRQEVMQDLENSRVLAAIEAFSGSMQLMRQNLAHADTLYHKLQKQRWFLDAVNVYCASVCRLFHDLSLTGIRSRGLISFKEYLASYTTSEQFTLLAEGAQKLTADLSAIRYTVFIKGLHVRVNPYAGEPDYSATIGATFERFKQGVPKQYTFQFINSPDMSSVEAEILSLVARLNPDTFSAFECFCAAHKDSQDPTIIRFDREIQFYVAYLEHLEQFKKAELAFCYPRITQGCKEVYNRQGFDLALAEKLIAEQTTVVCNDFHLSGGERMIVVSGPNQGGKTTFARTFGQLHYLASLGCPVPGTESQLFLFDQLFTHFEKEEDIKNLRGKLQDDLIRIHQILERATPNSVIIINEIFTSTTLQDSIFLSKEIAAKILSLDVLCVWVTFVDELATLGEQTISMVSTVAPENPALRTYKIVRRPADGLAYAMAIAEKYRLTYPMLKQRLAS